MDGSGSREAVLTRDDRGGVAWLSLNRPTARNALSVGLMTAIEAALADIEADRRIRVVVLAANGPAFCAGHDLRELRADPNPTAQQALFAQCSRVMLALQNLRVPVIARVHGIATAAGCQLVATCDLAVAADTARFATPGVNIGLFCSTPMVALTRNIGRKAAMEMLLLGEMVDAFEAKRLGLVNRVVPQAELDDAVEAMAEVISGKSAMTVETGKRAFYAQAEMQVRDAYAYTSSVMVRNLQALDAAEGIDAFLGRRVPIWRDS